MMKKRINNIKDLVDTLRSTGVVDNVSITNETTESANSENDGSDDDESDDDVYLTQSQTREITFIEFFIINSFLYRCKNGEFKDITVSAFGQIDNISKINYGGYFEENSPYWFLIKLDGDDNEFIVQTQMYVDNRNELITAFHLSSKNPIDVTKVNDLIKKIKNLSFNNSPFKGKCIKVKLKEGKFRGIEIIDFKDTQNELILNETQEKFIKHFIARLKRGGNARYLLNGEPGTGKTETIRDIVRELIPQITFIIPEFSTSDDLTSIMEACEIFDQGVIIMDDIDLYLGSRDNGSYTRLLGQFLSFFDGVKKRKISLLASTNDKGLVDKAAERPGRFNVTLDYSFLDDEQIRKVCDIHLPEKWRVKEVYEALTGRINGDKVNITGAFIANLADNVKEMSEEDPNWGIEETVSLIKESYKGFYSSQVEKEKRKLGFIN